LIRDWGKWALVAVLVFVLGAGVWVAYQLVGAAAGPEPELIALLKQTEKDGLRLAVPGASEALVSKAHHFDRFSVRIGPNGDTAEVACTLDFNGRLGETQVSSVGLERTAFEYRAGGWRPVSGLAPLLAQVVGALEARRHSVDLKAQGYQALAWFIRVEREQATATEDYQVVQPQDAGAKKHTRRLRLERRGNEFLISEGIL